MPGYLLGVVVGIKSEDWSSCTVWIGAVGEDWIGVFDRGQELNGRVCSCARGGKYGEGKRYWSHRGVMEHLGRWPESQGGIGESMGYQWVTRELLSPNQGENREFDQSRVSVKNWCWLGHWERWVQRNGIGKCWVKGVKLKNSIWMRFPTLDIFGAQRCKAMSVVRPPNNTHTAEQHDLISPTMLSRSFSQTMMLFQGILRWKLQCLTQAWLMTKVPEMNFQSGAIQSGKSSSSLPNPEESFHMHSVVNKAEAFQGQYV